MGIGGFGTFLGKLSDFLPGRKEMQRNKYAKLEKEKEKLLKKAPTEANRRRLTCIDRELRDLSQNALNQ